MRYSKAVLSILLILTLVAVVGACKKKPAEVPPPAETTAPPPAPTPPPAPPPPATPPPEPFKEPAPTRADLVDTWNREGRLKTIYFAFDSSELSEASRLTLQQNAAFLKADGSVANVVIEGHCDERGTIEYNLALGERRAGSVRDYLATLGVAKTRMRIITYGEERPADPGHSEGSWSKNRRAQFLIE
jgi:peptidoglycan-associated lipoprotein